MDLSIPKEAVKCLACFSTNQLFTEPSGRGNLIGMTKAKEWFAQAKGGNNWLPVGFLFLSCYLCDALSSSRKQGETTLALLQKTLESPGNSIITPLT